MKHLLLTLLLAVSFTAAAQTRPPLVYDETIDPMEQIDTAIAQAAAGGRFVVCQVGGNWCPWCLKLADFINKDEELTSLIADNFIYIHVNYPKNSTPEPLMARLGNPRRFGFPALVILDGDGKVVHIQDTSLLESGDGYDREKVLRALRTWTPQAVTGIAPSAK